MRAAGSLFIAAGLATLAVAASPVQAAPVARGSVEQVDVTGAPHGAKVVLLHRGRRVAAKRAGALGGVVFRHVHPGRGYRVKLAHRRRASRAVRVLSTRSAPPSTRIYDQRLPADGYGYLTTRDGTKLAVNVLLPAPADQGPYPTVIEYSGYGYADPEGGESSIQAVLNLLGYAVVDVNMRGTGCSGGAFDYFEPLQGLDGYDIVETVARQPWVLHHRPGMAGVSYGGISQLFVAATRPPSLAAITPLSVIDNTQTTLYPGGILNTGFALSWAKDRVHDALPASPKGGQAWALDRIRRGRRHLQGQSAPARPGRRPAGQDGGQPLLPAQGRRSAGADHLRRQDRRAHVPGLPVDRRADRRPLPGARLPLHRHDAQVVHLHQRRAHRLAGPGDLQPLVRLHGAVHRPAQTGAARRGQRRRRRDLPGGAGRAGAVAATRPDPAGARLRQRQGAVRGPAAGARAVRQRRRIAHARRAGGRLRAVVSHAADPRHPGPCLVPGRGRRAERRRAARRRPGRLRLEPEGAAGRPASPATPAAGLAGCGRRRRPTTGIPNPPGTAAAYLSAPLSADTAVIGAGAVDLWIQSSTPDVDLQVTVSEVRPDGKETFVQDGWLRASQRALDPVKSTELEPVLSLRRSTAAPLPAGRFTKVTVPLYYEGHVYRAGSRLRIVVAAPGGDQPVWEFGRTRPPSGRATVQIAHGASMPSRVLLPVVPGVAVPTPLPPCPGLRGEPCRDYPG